MCCCGDCPALLLEVLYPKACSKVFYAVRILGFMSCLGYYIIGLFNEKLVVVVAVPLTHTDGIPGYHLTFKCKEA